MTLEQVWEMVTDLAGIMWYVNWTPYVVSLVIGIAWGISAASSEQANAQIKAQKMEP